MEETNYINNQSNNQLQVTALQIRLDTTKILEDIELYLRGERTVLQQNDTGNIQVIKVKVGEKKANDLGIQSVMSFVAAIINPHTVQGNISEERYEQYIYETHINLVTNIVVNCYNWKIVDEDIDPIVDFIMSIVQLFVSRAIDNKERESYGESIRYVDSNNQGDKKEPGMFFR